MIRKTTLPLTLLALIGGAEWTRAQDLPATTAETIAGKRLDFPGVLRGGIATCVLDSARIQAIKSASGWSRSRPITSTPGPW